MLRQPKDGSLADRLRLHQMWCYGEAGGKRANLASADLAGAYLADANLARANLADAYLANAYLAGADLNSVRGNMREIKTMQADRWGVTWTMSPEGVAWLQIGCQRHPVEKWRSAPDRWIAKLDYDAADWWRKWKAPLLSVVDLDPATPWGTGGEG
jgi:hypothetical protein